MPVKRSRGGEWKRDQKRYRDILQVGLRDVCMCVCVCSGVVSLLLIELFLYRSPFNSLLTNSLSLSLSLTLSDYLSLSTSLHLVIRQKQCLECPHRYHLDIIGCQGRGCFNALNTSYTQHNTFQHTKHKDIAVVYPTMWLTSRQALT